MSGRHRIDGMCGDDSFRGPFRGLHVALIDVLANLDERLSGSRHDKRGKGNQGQEESNRVGCHLSGASGSPRPGTECRGIEADASILYRKVCLVVPARYIDTSSEGGCERTDG